MTRITEALAARMDRLRKGDKDKGFTLIELLVVVIIIGILAAIAIPVYIGVQNNAKDSAVKSDLGNLKTAVVSYLTSNNGTFPTISGATPTNLSDAGYPGQSTTYTTAPKFIGTPANGSFCIGAVGSTGNAFYVNQSGGVQNSGTALPASC